MYGPIEAWPRYKGWPAKSIFHIGWQVLGASVYGRYGEGKNWNKNVSDRVLEHNAYKWTKLTKGINALNNEMRKFKRSINKQRKTLNLIYIDSQ